MARELDKELNNEKLAGPVPSSLGCINARVVRIDQENVWLDIGAKYDAQLSRSEWTANEAPPIVGSVVTVLVDDDFNVDDRPLRVDRVNTKITPRHAAWKAFLGGQAVNGVISKAAENGFVVDCRGVQAILAWQNASDEMRAQPSHFVDKTIRVRISHVNDERREIYVQHAPEEVTGQ